MRIAYVTETFPPELNGVALTVERTVRHLRARGHEVDLLRPAPEGGLHEPAPDEWFSTGCPIPVYRDLRFGLAWPARVRARLAARRAQLVHVATPGPLAWAAVHAARSAGVALTSDFRTNFDQYSRYYGLGACEPLVRGLLRRFHNGTERTFVPTTAVRTALAAAGFERLAVVGRGVDTALFAPHRRSPALRAQWLANDEDGTDAGPVLLYVGRLAAEKNIGLVLRAHAAVKARQPGARLVMVGDGPLRAALERDHPEVCFAGRQSGEALAQHYASADLFVFPSLSETFGNVTLEAMASGLAIVAYDTAAAAQHLLDGHSARLAPPGDEAAFVAACCELAAAPGLARALGHAACESARPLRWDRILGRFEDQLAETLDAHQALAARLACLG